MFNDKSKNIETLNIETLKIEGLPFFYYDLFADKKVVDDPFLEEIRIGFNCGENRYKYELKRPINDKTDAIYFLERIWKMEIRDVSELEYNEGYSPEEEVPFSLQNYLDYYYQLRPKDMIEKETSTGKKLFIIDLRACNRGEVIISDEGEISHYQCCGI